MADMATQPITGLPNKTASQIAITDKLLGIDNAEGYQMLIQDLGDYIIQHATSSLGGSNQTLAAAINSLKSVNWIQNADLNTYTNDGIYWLSDGCTNCPSDDIISNGAIWGPIRVYSRGDTVRQVIYINKNVVPFVYIRVYQSQAWGSWVKQPTRAEMDALNSNTYGLTIGTLIPSGSDLDTFLTPGNYFCSNSTQAATLLHCPITNKGFAMKVEATNTNTSVLQTIFTRDTQEIIYRRSYYSGTSSFDSDWIKQPTRAEMDAVKEKTPWEAAIRPGFTTSGSTYTLSNSYRGFVILTNTSDTNCGMYIISSTTAGIVNAVPVRAVTDMTITTNVTNKITFAVNTSGTVRALFVTLSGSVTLDS